MRHSRKHKSYPDSVIDWADGRRWVQGSAQAIARSGLVVRAVGQGQRFQPAGRCRSTVTEYSESKESLLG
jgi:hypothetical protein